MKNKPQHRLYTPSISEETLANAGAANLKIWQDFVGNPPDFARIPSSLDPKPLESFARQAVQKFESVLVLGIGGSSLGAQALLSACPRGRAGLPVHFVDTVDPDRLAAVLRQIRLARTLVLVITKSGETLETMADFFAIRQKLGQRWTRQVVVITDPTAGYLRQLVRREKLTAFEIPSGVGGRYSLLTAAGGLPALLGGVSLRNLLAGAATASLDTAYELALTQAGLYTQGRPITVFLPYSTALRPLGEWYAQLLAESIGKSAEVGITPEVSVGPADQHSKLQLWLDGPADKSFLLFRVLQTRGDFVLRSVPDRFAQLKNRSLGEIIAAEYLGTRDALVEKRRPVLEFVLPELNAQTIGWLTQLLMLQVSLMGPLLGVNPFDQPAVERVKELTKLQLNKAKLKAKRKN